MTTDTRIGDVTIEEVDVATLSDDDVRALMAFWHVIDAEAHPEDPPVTFEAVVERGAGHAVLRPETRVLRT